MSLPRRSPRTAAGASETNKTPDTTLWPVSANISSRRAPLAGPGAAAGAAATASKAVGVSSTATTTNTTTTTTATTRTPSRTDMAAVSTASEQHIETGGRTPGTGGGGGVGRGRPRKSFVARYTPGRALGRPLAAPPLPTTPHGIRAWEQRAAGLTPGGGTAAATIARSRRKRRLSNNGRGVAGQRDTPRDLLRQLSRVLPRPQNREPTPPTRRQSLALPATVEEDQESEGDADSPRLSFGIHEDDSEYAASRASRAARMSIEKGRRAYPDAPDHSILVDDIDSDIDDEDAPTTKLLDDELTESDDGSIPEPTFGERDHMGDTAALRQLMSLAEDPATPEYENAPATPTGEMSFALDIPNYPLPEPEIVEDEEDGYEADELMFGSPEEAAAAATGTLQDLTMPQTMEKVAPLPLRALGRNPILAAQLSRAQVSKRPPKPRAPRREGLPRTVVKRIATSFLRDEAGGKKTRLKRGALESILKATDWFFEQASDDLAAYAAHAGRRKIDESDMLMLARRQRLFSKQSTLFSLAQRFLPQELLGSVKTARRAIDGG